MNRVVFPLIVFLSFAASAARAQIIDFEDLPSAANPLPAESFYNGSDGAAGFTDGGASFNNSYQDFGFGYYAWGGWAYSNQTATPENVDRNDPNYADYNYQYSAAAGSGSRQSSTYAIGYVDTYTPTIPKINLPAGEHPLSIQVTNNTYAAIAMKYGDAFVTTPFSGPHDDHPGDWFKLTITGLDASDNPIGSVDHYLADFRSPDPAQQYIDETWQNVNLFSLYDARSLVFTISSSDDGTGIPWNFAADDLSLTSLSGDVSHDGVVNAADITIIASNWLKAGPVGDANGDGIVNAADITLVASNWLSTLPLDNNSLSGGTTSVPEPSAGVLALCGIVMLAAAAKLRR